MPTVLYAVPLTVIISICYCATRYEMPSRIFQSAGVMFLKTMLGLAALYGVLWLLSS